MQISVYNSLKLDMVLRCSNACQRVLLQMITRRTKTYLVQELLQHFILMPSKAKTTKQKHKAFH